MSKDVQNIIEIAETISRMVVNEQKVIQEELEQIQKLVSDAVRTISDNYMNLSGYIDKQKTVIDSIVDQVSNNDSLEEARCEIRNLSEKIQANKSAIIRALQFDDIANQAAAHSNARVKHMEALFSSVLELLQSTQAEKSSKKQVDMLLSEMKEQIEKHQKALQKTNPVTHTNVDEGGIELF